MTGQTRSVSSALADSNFVPSGLKYQAQHRSRVPGERSPERGLVADIPQLDSAVAAAGRKRAPVGAETPQGLRKGVQGNVGADRTRRCRCPTAGGSSRHTQLPCRCPSWLNAMLVTELPPFIGWPIGAPCPSPKVQRCL